MADTNPAVSLVLCYSWPWEGTTEWPNIPSDAMSHFTNHLLSVYKGNTVLLNEKQRKVLAKRKIPYLQYSNIIMLFNYFGSIESLVDIFLPEQSVLQ